MTSTRRYIVEDDASGISVTLDVNHEQLTPALADEIVRFWTDWEHRLSREDGNAVTAAIKLAAQRFMALLLEEQGTHWAQSEFDSSEGWPPNRDHGVTLVDWDGVPELHDDDFTMREVPRP